MRLMTIQTGKYEIILKWKRRIIGFREPLPPAGIRVLAVPDPGAVLVKFLSGGSPVDLSDLAIQGCAPDDIKRGVAGDAEADIVRSFITVKIADSGRFSAGVESKWRFIGNMGRHQLGLAPEA